MSSTNEPLLVQVQQVTRRARLQSWRRAISRWLVLALAILAMIGCVDYVFRLRGDSSRWLIFFLFLLGVAVAWWRLVRPLQSFPWSDLATARGIERRFPALRDRLSSAVDFLSQPDDDPRFGSRELRRAVIQSAAEASAKYPFREALTPLSFWRAEFGPVVATIVAACLLAYSPTSVRIAVQRIVAPWTGTEWPRQYELVVLHPPTCVALGETLRVDVAARAGSLPPDVTFHYWFDGDDPTRIRAYSIESPGTVASHQFPNVTKSFRFRVTGGDDDDMAWHPVRVVVPPRVVKSDLELHPPAYSGLSPEKAERGVQVLAGTRVEGTVYFDRPLRMATLRFQADSITEAIPTQLSSAGTRATFPVAKGPAWVLTSSGTYAWDLISREGLQTLAELDTDVTVVPDAPPQISVHSPTPHGLYTANALIPLQITVTDDLAVRKVTATIPGSELALYHSPSPPPRSQSFHQLSHQTLSVDHTWDLAANPTSQPGAQVNLLVAAEDFLGQSAAPVSVTITLLSPSDFEARLAERQGEILRQLRESWNLQRNSHKTTSTLTERLVAEGEPVAGFNGAWLAVESSQRRVGTLLDADNGALGALRQLQRDLDINRWRPSAPQPPWKEIDRQLTIVTSNQIPDVLRSLSRAEHALRLEPPQPAESTRSGKEAAQRQGEILQSLEAIIDQLVEWDQFQQLAGQVQAVLAEQTSLDRQMEQSSSIGRDKQQLNPEERARLERMSDDLASTAADVDRVQSRLEQIESRFSQRRDPGFDTVQRALQLLEDRLIGERVRNASQAAAENRLGVARRELTASREALVQLAQILEPSEDEKANSVSARPADGAGRAGPAEKDTARDSLRLTEKDWKEIQAAHEALRTQTENLDRARAPGSSWTKSQLDELRRLATGEGDLAGRLGVDRSVAPPPATSPAGQPAPPAPQASALDQALLDDSPTPTPAVPPDTKVAGQGATDRQSSPVPMVGQNLRTIERLLLESDAGSRTQELQRAVSGELANLLRNLQRQSSDEESSSTSRGDESIERRATPHPTDPRNRAARPGGGAGEAAADPSPANTWARRVWGVLPARARDEIQDFSDEQFLPEYETLIRRYYERLAEQDGPEANSNAPPP